MNEVMAVLATFGITTLISDYVGPYNVFINLRNKYRVFDCNVCLTPYVALVLSLAFGFGILQYLAIVGATMILARNL